jgi:hypothetical protein
LYEFGQFRFDPQNHLLLSGDEPVAITPKAFAVLHLSAISESEAKRFGLRVVAAPIKIGDVIGTEFDSRVAVADEVTIGLIQLRHVAFLVLSDSQPPFNQSKPGEGGLIGLPVVLALQRLVWADKKFEIGAKSLNAATPHADMCFDGQHPITQIQFGGRRLQVTLDTGATNTDLTRHLRLPFPKSSVQQRSRMRTRWRE